MSLEGRFHVVGHFAVHPLYISCCSLHKRLFFLLVPQLLSYFVVSYLVDVRMMWRAIGVACLRSVWAKGNFSDHEDNWADRRRFEGVGFGGTNGDEELGKAGLWFVGATRDGTGKGCRVGVCGESIG